MIPIHDDNPTSLTPWITFAFMGLCIGAFITQSWLDADAARRAVYGLGMIPAVVSGLGELPPGLVVVPAGISVFTAMFLHAGLLHLLGNLLYLWIFGNNVEDAMGHGRFVAFYLLCGACAAAAQTLADPSSQIPMIGASGAVAGVLGAYLLLYPNATVTVVVYLFVIARVIQVPAGLLLVVWFAVQIVSSLLTPAGTPGVAWYAHIGGFVAGIALIPVFKSAHVPLLHPATRPEHPPRG